MEEIAAVYSRALFEVANDHDVLDDVHEQLGQFCDALEGSKELQVFLFAPYFSSEEKKDGIAQVIKGGDENFVRFLQLLAENHRVAAIFRIRKAFEALWAEERKLLPVEVTSAVELDEKTVAGLGERIEEQTGRTVQLSSHVDPDVLGGLVLQVGNMVLDASIRNRLERLRKEVAKAA